jgi:hypothetical protein
MKEYINLSEKELTNTGNVKRSKPTDKLHQRGPFVFYITLFIIIIQLIQLNHFDVAMINNLRGSLINIFYISPKKTSRLDGIQYFSETTSRVDFKHWIKNMTSDDGYEDHDFSLNMPNNFFSQKCMFLGPPILIKFDTKLKGRTYATKYGPDTMRKFYLLNIEF